MIHSTRAITLVLISAATVLGGYAAFDAAHQELADDQWTGGPASTQPYSGRSSYHGTHYYYHGHRTGSYYGSSGGGGSGSVAHGTSRGGFGAHGGRGGS